MGCLDCSIQLLSEKINCSIEAKDLLNVYLYLLNKNIVIDNNLKYIDINIDNIPKELLSITNIPLKALTIDITNLGNITISNKYVPLDYKTVYISNKALDRLKIELKDYTTRINNIVLNSFISIESELYNIKTINIINNVKDRLSIKHSMMCNIADHILLISENEELIIDESGNFFIEISEY